MAIVLTTSNMILTTFPMSCYYQRRDTMKYPKPIMSITELVKLGFSYHALKQWVHIKGFHFLDNLIRNEQNI